MPPKSHLTSEQRREKTVQAVIDLCAIQDPANITTGDIAKQMNVTQGALFRHFANKDEVWQSVIEWVAEKVMNKLNAAVNPTDKPLTQLQAMYLAHIEFIARHPGVPRLLLGQLQHPQPTVARKMVQTLLSRYRSKVKLLLSGATEQAELAPNIDIEAAATQYIGMIQGLVIQSLLMDDIGYLQSQASNAFQLYCYGICQDRGAL